MSKKTELMLAVWSNANQREYWTPSDTCRSMWLEIRSVIEEDGAYDLDSYNDGIYTLEVGIYVWVSTGYGCVVELKAHNIYSADSRQLKTLAKWLDKMNAKIAKAAIPENFGVRETLVLTLRAMGIRQGILVKSDANYKSCHEVMSLDEALALSNYARPLQEMEEKRQTPYEGREAA